MVAQVRLVSVLISGGIVLNADVGMPSLPWVVPFSGLLVLGSTKLTKHKILSQPAGNIPPWFLL